MIRDVSGPIGCHLSSQRISLALRPHPCPHTEPRIPGPPRIALMYLNSPFVLQTPTPPPHPTQRLRLPGAGQSFARSFPFFSSITLSSTFRNRRHKNNNKSIREMQWEGMNHQGGWDTECSSRATNGGKRDMEQVGQIK